MWVNAQFPKFPEKNKQTSGFYTDVGSIEYIWTPCLLHSSFGVSLAFWWDFQGFIDIYNQAASPIWQHDYETSYRDLRLLLHSSTKSMFSLISLPLCENNEGTYWWAFQTFDHHFPNGRLGATVFLGGAWVRMAPAITSIVFFSGFIEWCMSFCCLGGMGETSELRRGWCSVPTGLVMFICFSTDLYIICCLLLLYSYNKYSLVLGFLVTSFYWGYCGTIFVLYLGVHQTRLYR